MINILFVCHGNICRSPMAEFVMKDMLKKQRVENQFHVESAATSADELGNPVHPGTRRKLEAAGISCRGKTARQMTRTDYDRFQYIIAMDDLNIANLLRLLGGDPEEKLHKLLSFAGQEGDVADPWYTGNFDQTWRDVTQGCSQLLDFLLDKEGEPKR